MSLHSCKKAWEVGRLVRSAAEGDSSAVDQLKDISDDEKQMVVTAITRHREKLEHYLKVEKLCRLNAVEERKSQVRREISALNALHLKIDPSAVINRPQL
ncbi:MAG: hypothetical protein ABL890_00295 [Candidatus Peribacteraceae bacterium]